MTWYEQSLYNLLPHGVYIRCCRVVKAPSDFGGARRYNVSVLQLRRSWYKKAIILSNPQHVTASGYIFRHSAEEEAWALHEGYAFYLRGNRLTESTAIELLSSKYLLDYMWFDPGMNLPDESPEMTKYRLVPEEHVRAVQALMEMMA